MAGVILAQSLPLGIDLDEGVRALSEIVDCKPGEVQIGSRVQVKFEKAQVTSAFAELNCTGTIDAFSYDAQADLARLESELGQFAEALSNFMKFKHSKQAAPYITECQRILGRAQ